MQVLEKRGAACGLYGDQEIMKEYQHHNFAAKSLPTYANYAIKQVRIDNKG